MRFFVLCYICFLSRVDRLSKADHPINPQTKLACIRCHHTLFPSCMTSVSGCRYLRDGLHLIARLQQDQSASVPRALLESIVFIYKFFTTGDTGSPQAILFEEEMPILEEHVYRVAHQRLASFLPLTLPKQETGEPTSKRLCPKLAFLLLGLRCNHIQKSRMILNKAQP